jgi:uncharacterized protein (DUF2062 family)
MVSFVRKAGSLGVGTEMLFRRRNDQGRWDQLRVWLWPRVSWRRSALYYLKRILRLSGTPHAIALGTAIGVAATFTPFIGFHFAITFAVAWLLGGNMLAGAIGTLLGNPLTFPLIWASTYQLGDNLIRGWASGAPEDLDHAITHRSLSEILPLIEPMIIGSIPLGLAAGVVTYLAVGKAVAAYQEARQRRFGERRGVGRGASQMVGMGQRP